MDLSFGTRLRLQRERQNVTLAAIAEQTKIRASLLEGLERDDVSQWPGGIFRRAYVRSYAQAIGLDGDSVVREFLERYPDPLDIEIPSATVPCSPGKRPPTRIETLFGSAVGTLPPLRGAGPKGAARTGDAEDTADAATPPRHEPIQLGDYLAASVAVAPQAAPDEPAATDAQSHEVHTPAAASHASESAEPRTDTAGRDVERELSAVAELCTKLARAQEAGDLGPILDETARLLRASGVTIWLWDPRAGALRPVLAHGYSAEVLARLPRVRRDADNAIAEAFRSASTRVVKGEVGTTGALVVPLAVPHGCAGVLALELRDGAERREAVRAIATILAAQLSAVIECPPLLQAVSA